MLAPLVMQSGDPLYWEKVRDGVNNSVSDVSLLRTVRTSLGLEAFKVSFLVIFRGIKDKLNMAFLMAVNLSSMLVRVVWLA